MLVSTLLALSSILQTTTFVMGAFRLLWMHDLRKQRWLVLFVVSFLAAPLLVIEWCTKLLNDYVVEPK